MPRRTRAAADSLKTIAATTRTIRAMELSLEAGAAGVDQLAQGSRRAC